MKHDFAVIDVNLPKHVTEDDDTQEYEQNDSVESRTREATQLLTYLWDNYIELNEPSHVFLVGTNTGHGAIVNFIKAHEERAQDQLTTAISFIHDVPLQSCKSPTNDILAQWYYASSMVFVTPDHNFWSSDLARKPKKRFGRIKQSSKETITDMLVEHKDAVLSLLREKTASWRAQKSQVEDDAMDTTLSEAVVSPKRMPPIGNFALTPTRKAAGTVKSPSLPTASNFSSPKGARARSPGTASPHRAPALNNSALPPQQRSIRSPAR